MEGLWWRLAKCGDGGKGGGYGMAGNVEGRNRWVLGLASIR